MNNKMHASQVGHIKLLKVVLSKWHWLLSIVLIGVGLCFCYLSYTPKQYRTNASLKFEEKKSEISELLTVRNLYDRTNKIESEQNVLLSRKVLTSAIKAIDYEIAFFEKNSFQMLEYYPKKPMEVTIIKKSTLHIAKNRFEYRRINEKQFRLCLESLTENYCKTYNFGQNIDFSGILFTIERPRTVDSYKTIFFKLLNTDEVITTILNAIKIDDSQNTNILSINYTGTNAAFCVDITNSIIQEYIKFDIKQKQSALSQTSRFLSVLLDEISEKAKISSSALQAFKEQNKLSNISSFSAEHQSAIESLKTEKHMLEMDSKVLKFVSEHIGEPGTTELLTYDLQGIKDPQLQTLVEKYHETILKRREKLNTFTSSSDIVIILDRQIRDFRHSIAKALSEHLNLNRERVNYLTKLTDSIGSLLKSLPQKERIAFSLISNFEIDQKVHSFLAQKKLETQIVNAAIVPGATILDEASYPTEPLKPIPRNSYLVAIFLSLLAGTFLITSIHLYNPLIYTRENIQQLTSIPILGVISRSPEYKNGRHNEIVLRAYPRSSFAESIRFIRSNLTYITPNKGQVICITSEVSGEGKSFISLNLSYSLTLLQKNVVLIAGDLRNSNLHEAFNLDNTNGLSKYLSGQSDVESICIQTSFAHLDVICAGPIPPNPSELLQTELMDSLIKKLKLKYDVILIDSAPIGLVSDIKPVMKIADINLFILRSGVSKHNYALSPEKLKTELGLSSVAIILTDFKHDRFHNQYYKNIS